MLLEIATARLALAIYKEEIKSAGEALKSLQDIYPRDDDFQSAFSQKEELSNPKAQYILRRLEEEERRLAMGAMPKEIDVGASLTVEHILPKKPGADWKAVCDADPGIVEDCVARLGNLCLLTKVNREAGQAAFEVKRAIYAQSELYVTRQVADSKAWGREEIAKRQAHMAKLAVNAWRVQ